MSFLMVVTLCLNFPLGKVRIEWMPENLSLQVKTNSFVFSATRRRVLSVAANDISEKVTNCSWAVSLVVKNEELS